MKLSFNDAKLKRCAEDESFSVRKLGTIRSKLYLRRINDFLNADNLEELRYMPGNYHELIGNRKGEWACNLDQPYRLIFRPIEEPIPLDNNGNYIWVEILGVEIMEIDNYHSK